MQSGVGILIVVQFAGQGQVMVRLLPVTQLPETQQRAKVRGGHGQVGKGQRWRWPGGQRSEVDMARWAKVRGGDDQVGKCQRWSCPGGQRSEEDMARWTKVRGGHVQVDKGHRWTWPGG